MMSDQIGALYIGHCADGYTTKHTVDQLQALVAAGRDCDGCSREFGVLIEVQNTHLLRHFMLNLIILPRQARGKHRENSKKMRFLQMAVVGRKVVSVAQRRCLA